ncbi:MAG: PHP domain-containing protein [bacterium]|nr:PHP domain-containing protein [bacterium]
MYLYDLHTHTNHSDGNWPPERVMEIAREKRLKTIIITDHDVISSLPSAAAAAKKYGFEFFEGLEINTKQNGLTIHILGYSKNFDRNILTTGLKSNVEGYNQRADILINQLKERGLLKDTDFKTILENKVSGCLFEYDIIKELGKTDGLSVKDAKKLISRGNALYIPYGDWILKPLQAIDLIHRASGMAILAHPGEIVQRYLKIYKDKSPEEIETIVLQLIDKLSAQGLDGLEVYHSKHSEEEIKIYKRAAEKNNLLITGGSDWHGHYFHPEIEMGMAGLTEELFEKFKKAIKENTPTFSPPVQ